MTVPNDPDHTSNSSTRFLVIGDEPSRSAVVTWLSEEASGCVVEEHDGGGPILDRFARPPFFEAIVLTTEHTMDAVTVALAARRLHPAVPIAIVSSEPSTTSSVARGLGLATTIIESTATATATGLADFLQNALAR